MGQKLDLDHIVDELAKGSKPAFEKLFRLYFPRLKKYAFYFLKNSSEAEDLVQDVFFQIWKNRRMLKSEKHFAAFIFTLVKNRCLNSFKRRIVEEKFIASQAKVESEELYHISFDIEGNFSSMEEKLYIELEKIISEMPERCQVAFRLKWIEGKKNREIAEIMKISTTMVDKHLAKGLKIVRKELTPGLFLFLSITRG